MYVQCLLFCVIQTQLSVWYKYQGSSITSTNETGTTHHNKKSKRQNEKEEDEEEASEEQASHESEDSE